jgi:hypothetical protein
VARIRTIKPTFFSSLDIAKYPYEVRIHFAGLWTYADDAGRGADDARLIRAAIWPLDDAITVRKVERMQEALEAGGHIVRYEVDGRRWFAVVAESWKHQRIDKPQASRIPPPPIPEDSTTVPGPLPEAAANGTGTLPEGSRLEGKGRERKGEESSSSSSSDSRPPLDRPAGDGAPAKDESSTEQRIVDAVDLLAERHLAAAVDRGDAIAHRSGWLDRDRHLTTTRCHAAAVSALERFPDLGPAELADVLEGGALPLRHRLTPPPTLGDGPTDDGRAAAASARSTLTRTRRKARP